MYQLVNSEDREENEIGFDQLFFDDEDKPFRNGCLILIALIKVAIKKENILLMKQWELYRKISEGVIKEDYKNDYANSEEDYTDKMVVGKNKRYNQISRTDPQDLIDEIRIEFGLDAMD